MAENRFHSSAGVTVPRPPPSTTDSAGVQATSSFHSVSSMDSSAEMARYFPDAHTPSLSPFRHHQGVEDQQHGQSTSVSHANAGPYRPVTGSSTGQPGRGQVVQNSANNARPPPGVPSYVTQFEGLSVSQALVNDVIVDLQSKVINESQQQYLSESSTGNYLEPLTPIHIRAPNPTIILRSDLNRLRAEFNQNARARAQQRFQAQRFPNPRQQRFTAPGGFY